MLQMTQSEYARHRGVTRQTIHKLIQSGRIPLIATGDGRKMIDVVAADRALGEARERVAVDDDHLLERTAPGSLGGLTRAKTTVEEYNARLKQLEYEERVRELVRIDDVTRSMVCCAEVIVRELDRLPSRAEDLAAVLSSGGTSALRSALKDVTRELRRTLAENMRILATEERPDEDGAAA
jgi:hypothetical protein